MGNIEENTKTTEIPTAARGVWWSASPVWGSVYFGPAPLGNCLADQKGDIHLPMTQQVPLFRKEMTSPQKYLYKMFITTLSK